MDTQLLELLQKMKFCQKDTKRTQNFFFTYLFSRTHVCRYTLVVGGLQINKIRLSPLVPACTLPTRVTCIPGLPYRTRT